MSTEKEKTSAPSSSSSPSVELCKGVNGLEKILLRESRGSSAEVYLYGGHVTSWKNDHGEELLFLSNKPQHTGFLTHRNCGRINCIFWQRQGWRRDHNR